MSKGLGPISGPISSGISIGTSPFLAPSDGLHSPGNTRAAADSHANASSNCHTQPNSGKRSDADLHPNNIANGNTFTHART